MSSTSPTSRCRRSSAEAVAKRRIGLGVTGLANALTMCGVRYGSPEAAALAGRWTSHLKRAAYAASAELAREKGPFPLFDRDAFLARPNVASARRRHPPADRRARHPQRPADLDRANRHNLAVRQQRIERHRAGVRSSLCAQGAGGGRQPARGGGGGRRAPAVPRKVRRRTGVAAGLRHRRRADAVRACRHAGGAAAAHRQCHLEDHQLPGRHLVRGFPVGLSRCLSARPQGLHHLSAERGHWQRAVGVAAGTAGRLTVPPSLRRRRHRRQSRGEAGSRRRYRANRCSPAITYKLRWPESDHAIYVTINDTEVDGIRRPFEIFINSKNLEHYAWTVALTRMISAVFRRGGDVGFVVEELKSVFDPRGGQWLHGQYVPSLLAAIGGLIETHMQAIGFLPASDRARDVSPASSVRCCDAAATAPRRRRRRRRRGPDRRRAVLPPVPDADIRAAGGLLRLPHLRILEVQLSRPPGGCCDCPWQLRQSPTYRETAQVSSQSTTVLLETIGNKLCMGYQRRKQPAQGQRERSWKPISPFKPLPCLSESPPPMS